MSQDCDCGGPQGKEKLYVKGNLKVGWRIHTTPKSECQSFVSVSSLVKQSIML